jgi:hypothetical protein
MKRRASVEASVQWCKQKKTWQRGANGYMAKRGWSDELTLLVCWPLGVIVARWQVFDPSAWCGAASMTVFGGRGDPSFVESSLGVKVTGARGGEYCLCGKILTYLVWALVARPSSWSEETWWPGAYLGGAPMWTMSGFDLPNPLIYVFSFHTCNLCVFTFVE